MKALFFTLALASLSATAAEPKAQAELACDAGPVQREFGASTWNIYGCSDHKSVVVVPLSAIDGDFGYFFVAPDGKGVTVTGEGWGKDMTFQPVFQQLKQVTALELAAIVTDTQAAKPAASTAK